MDIEDYIMERQLKILQIEKAYQKKKIDQIIHHKVGQAVRQTIKRIGGTMPEDLPTPSKSVKQIEEGAKKQIKINEKNIKNKGGELLRNS